MNSRNVDEKNFTSNLYHIIFVYHNFNHISEEHLIKTKLNLNYCKNIIFNHSIYILNVFNHFLINFNYFKIKNNLKNSLNNIFKYHIIRIF